MSNMRMKNLFSFHNYHPFMAHELSVEKGWWSDDDLNRAACFDPELVAAKLALVHSEITEAWEAVETRNLDNFGEELADVAIRIFDLLGAINRVPDVLNLHDEHLAADVNYSPLAVEGLHNVSGGEHLCRIHKSVSHALEAVRVGDVDVCVAALLKATARAFYLAWICGIDLEHQIVKKHERNKSRSHRHGGKRI